MNTISTKTHNPTGKTTQELQAEAIRKLQTTICDIVGLAGAIKYFVSEEYEAKIELFAYALRGTRLIGLKDLGKQIDKHLTGLKKIATRLEIRLILPERHAVVQDTHYGVLLALKALLNLPEDRIYEEAILLSQKPIPYTRRHHFMFFLDQVLDKARTSDHDAIQMVQSLLNELKEANIDPVKVNAHKQIEIKTLKPIEG
jgi:hypothetical protein